MAEAISGGTTAKGEACAKMNGIFKFKSSLIIAQRRSDPAVGQKIVPKEIYWMISRERGAG
jgi:hypothetical protein